jgi:pimeloyl-ACP methyl ester carboxylesterase
MWRKRIEVLDVNALIDFGHAIYGRDDVTNRLHTVDVPTLVLAAGEDLAFSPSGARRMAAAIPGADLIVVSNAGHISTVTHPEEVNRTLLRFLGA